MNLDNFYLYGFCICMVDTLPIQYSHIEHMHEGVWSKKFFFDKLTALRT